MSINKESDLLEIILAIAERGYAQAYRFLLDAYEKEPEQYGPQTLYFLACLAGGAEQPEAALGWLQKAVVEHGWWYRPEVLKDEDLAALQHDAAFVSLKSVSDARYAAAVSQAQAVFSWERKTAETLLLAVHGNTQNGQTARADWQAALEGADDWQIETVQSAEPDGYGTYRWSYDGVSYVPVENAMEKMQDVGYQNIVCGGFSAGCDMLLRAIAFTAARCDVLLLQSPWIPVLQAHTNAVVQAIREKKIALKIFCGDEDADCLPLAKRLYAAARRECPQVQLTLQKNTRHQFPAAGYRVADLEQREIMHE